MKKLLGLLGLLIFCNAVFAQFQDIPGKFRYPALQASYVFNPPAGVIADTVGIKASYKSLLKAGSIFYDTVTKKKYIWYGNRYNLDSGASAVQVQSDWQQTDNTSASYIKNKPIFAKVAFTGNFFDLTAIPNTVAGYNITDAMDTNVTITINGIAHKIYNNASWTVTAAGLNSGNGTIWDNTGSKVNLGGTLVDNVIWSGANTYGVEFDSMHVFAAKAIGADGYGQLTAEDSSIALYAQTTSGSHSTSLNVTPHTIQFQPDGITGLNGYVWTLVDQTTGAGSWVAASGGITTINNGEGTTWNTGTGAVDLGGVFTTSHYIDAQTNGFEINNLSYLTYDLPNGGSMDLTDSVNSSLISFYNMSGGGEIDFKDLSGGYYGGINATSSAVTVFSAGGDLQLSSIGAAIEGDNVNLNSNTGSYQFGTSLPSLLAVDTTLTQPFIVENAGGSSGKMHLTDWVSYATAIKSTGIFGGTPTLQDVLATNGASINYDMSVTDVSGWGLQVAQSAKLAIIGDGASSDNTRISVDGINKHVTIIADSGMLFRTDYSVAPSALRLRLQAGTNTNLFDVYFPTDVNGAKDTLATQKFVRANAGSGSTTNAATFNNSGTGAASGTTFDGSNARTISWNTIGAEPTITAANTTNKYWNGYKSFVSLNADSIANGTTNKFWSNSLTIGSTLTGYTSGAGTVSSSDNILQAIQKLNGNISAIGTYSADGTTLNLSGSTFSIKSTYIGQTSLTTLGTVTTGVWQGTQIANSFLANSTISGISLGGNLATHTAGWGFTSASQTATYNGSAVKTWDLDSNKFALAVDSVGVGTNTWVTRTYYNAHLPAGTTFANPSASIGMTAINGSATTAMRSDAAQAINAAITPSWTGLHTWQFNSLGTTTTDAAIYSNTTAAATGAQQVSPATHWQGQGWKTTSTAASQSVDFRAYVLPVQGTTNPTGNWILQSSVNGAAYISTLTVNSSGTQIVVGGSTGIPSIVLNANAGSLSNGINITDASGTLRGGLNLNTASGEVRLLANSGGFFPTFYSNGAEISRISTGGNWLLGTTTDGTGKLQVAGNGYFSTGIGLGTVPVSTTWEALATGTTTKAPIVITRSGAALNTTPQDGAIEVDASHIYHVISSTRYQLDQQAVSSTYTSTATNIANTTSPTVSSASYTKVGNTVFGSIIGNVTIGLLATTTVKFTIPLSTANAATIAVTGHFDGTAGAEDFETFAQGTSDFTITFTATATGSTPYTLSFSYQL